MTKTKSVQPFSQGAFDGLVFFPILAPFSLLFGVTAAGLKLTIFETLGFSLGVFAGASQFASLYLLDDGAPILIALLAGFTLNLRFSLYSANLAPHFARLSVLRRIWLALMMVDQNFVLSDTKFAEEPHWTQWQKSSYYLGIMAVLALPWHFFTILGYYTGARIPPEINISFALPLSFIALIMPALKTRAHILAAIISVLGALLLHKLPYNLGLFIAGLCAIIAAGQFELYQKRRRHEP